jgi:hypothetical protein
MLDHNDWQQANQRYLMAHLDRVRQWLKHAIDSQQSQAETPGMPHEPVMEHSVPATLDMLAELCDLSAFERGILLLCAGIELDSVFAALCAAAQGDSQRNYPTFSLALAALPGAYWAALSPDAPLRHWHMIEVEPGRSLMSSPLRIDERILHYLVGVACLDAQLSSLFHTVEPSKQLVLSHLRIAQQVAASWNAATQSGALPVIQFCGSEMASQQAIAAAACELVGHTALQVSAMALSAHPAELEQLLLLWKREATLSNRALLLDCQEVEKLDSVRAHAIARVVETNTGLLMLSSRERRALPPCELLTFDVLKPTDEEQYLLWQAALGEQAAALDGQVHRLVSHFHLNASDIQATYTGAQGRLAAVDNASPEQMSDLLWEVCREQARPHLDELAQRIEPAAAWDDLVIPDAQRAILRNVALQVRQRTQVYDAWGFRSKGSRGLGISALFTGASGVGKTMAAEVLANELRLDLYRIDLSAVVSKYIGETEKNLRQIFDRAEEGGVILLFDEADALFGKRSEVKDSHDRYANIEISYLLQRMEAYRGLAILTTNMKDTLDTAFMRRIRFVVNFPFPDALHRAEIWRRIFPSTAPTEGLDVQQLAQMNVAGGNIRSIALNAAFLAADCGESIRMRHILRAARSEYTRLEKTLTSSETRGWDEAESH